MLDKILLIQTKKLDQPQIAILERDLVVRQSGKSVHDFVVVNTLADDLSAVVPQNYSYVMMLGGSSVDISRGERSWFADVWRIIHECAASNVPFFGICLGMQFLAWSYGAKLEKWPDRREIGVTTIRTSRRPGSFFDFLPVEFRVNMMHSDFVASLPRPLVNYGSSENGPYQIIAHDSRPLFGVQFHPEHTPQSIAAILATHPDDCCRADDRERMAASMMEPDDMLKSFIPRFLDL